MALEIMILALNRHENVLREGECQPSPLIFGSPTTIQIKRNNKKPAQIGFLR
jgi:hypothetical protein